MAFGNTLFQWQQGEVFLCRSRFIPELMAKDYTDEQNKLNPLILNALRAERLIDENNTPRFLNENVSYAYYSGVPVMSPAILFFAGDIDLHQILFKEWGNDYDFIMPGDEIYGCDKNKTPIPLSVVCKKVESFFLPFVRGVLQLRDAGFSRLMIHCLPPRSKSPAKCHWMDFNLALRAKITIIANSYLAQFCQRENIGYIDSWTDEVVENGYVRDHLDIDGVHLVKSATLVSLRKVMEYLYRNTALTYNSGRYRTAIERSATIRTNRNAIGIEEWNEKGVVSGFLGDSVVAPLHHGLTFTVPEYKLERLDWVENISAPREGILVATPSMKHLEIASHLLATGMADHLLHMGASHEFTISSFRPVRVGQPTLLSHPSVPPGARKALLHLKGKGSIQFTSTEHENIKELQAQRGLFAVYDPNRVNCRYIPDGEVDLDMIEITAIPRTPKQPFRIIGAGLKDCPVDPFSYSTSGIIAFPAFEGEYFLERAIPHAHDL